MENENGWGIFRDEKINNLFHIYPVDEDHSQEIISGGLPPPISDCSCQPKVQWNEDKKTWIMVHGAFDGRECIEETNEILSHERN